MSGKSTLLTLAAVLLIGGSLSVVIIGSSNSSSTKSTDEGDSLATMKTASAAESLSAEEALKRVMELKFNKKNCTNPPKDLQRRAADAQFYVAMTRPGRKEYQAEKKLANAFIQFKNECSKRGLMN
ncbi:MAG: hypothetical protein LUC43_09210 [Burkholderiales bacterium]|nr:hypothetical protein [Burkholderiales bacterium]